MKICKSVLLLIFFLASALHSQTGQLESQSNLFGSEKKYDTKSTLSYYQKVYNFEQMDFAESFMPEYDVDKQKIAEQLRNILVLDGPVDPEKYIVGPGDVIQIDVWGEIPLNLPLPVTPEGMLLIPSYGPVNIAGKTLTEAKKEISEKLSSKFLRAEISTTLLQPRLFTVYVSGAVKNPGNQYAMAVQRVDQAVYLANLSAGAELADIARAEAEEKELARTPDALQYFNDNAQFDPQIEMSLRNIKIIRKTGDTLYADLVSFYATGSLEHNPYLSDGDRVIVPNLNLEGNSITVSGAVRLSGTYEYSPHDKISQILDIAQGTTAFADLQAVDLYSLTVDGYNYRKVNLQAILQGTADDINLQPGDRVVIREKYPRNKALSVTVKGEVIKPGLYPIVKNGTKIKDIIKQAGGFTNLAALNQAKVIRYRDVLDKSKNNPDYQRLLEMRLSDLDEEQRAYFNMEATIKRNILSVDFSDLFVNGNENADIFLEDGDLILIPQEDKAVYIYGQIAQPGYLEYIEGEDYESYIDRAGGTTIMAECGDIMVIKAGTQQWFDPDDTTIEPGDTIFIPREKDRDFIYYFNWFSRVVSVLGGVATVILLLQK